jgi:hypothetical protein
MRACRIARPELPRTLERTLPSFRFASSRVFWIRKESWEISRTSLRVRVRSRNSWIGAGGTKLERISPCASRSARACLPAQPLSLVVVSHLRVALLRCADAASSSLV